MFIWSAPLSLPARSIKYTFPKAFFPFFKVICKIAWDLDD
jgi:hypothetical protein